MATKIEKNLKEKLKQLLRPLVSKVPNKLRYGRYYRNFYKEIDNFFNLKIEEKRELQLKKIQQIVKYAYFNVPYYRELFDKNNISYKIKTFDDFEKIPYLTKDIIRENLEKLKSVEKIKCNKITTVERLECLWNFI
jgi:phenylacetate-CoA ligase